MEEKLDEGILATASGIPFADHQNSLTAGPRGPMFFQDFHLLAKMAHVNRECLPERVVHGQGLGAGECFEVTAHCTKEVLP